MGCEGCEGGGLGRGGGSGGQEDGPVAEEIGVEL